MILNDDFVWVVIAALQKGQMQATGLLPNSGRGTTGFSCIIEVYVVIICWL